ncbi:YciI family protein [Rhizobiaceae bacterium]|nr:YciI family protein [Rhizobiaceae bacterium]
MVPTVPAWNEYKTTARDRGALAFELFVVESLPSASPEEMKVTLPAHLTYQAQIEASGHLFLAGPLSDDTGEHMSGGGLMIYRSASMEEARSIAEADPMHAEGKRSFKIRKWLVNEGSPSFGTALSTGAVKLL